MTITPRVSCSKGSYNPYTLDTCNKVPMNKFEAIIIDNIWNSMAK